jgi:hypothetical protein
MKKNMNDALRTMAVEMLDDAAKDGDPLAIVASKLHERKDEVPVGWARYEALMLLLRDSTLPGDRGLMATGSLELIREAVAIGREYQLEQTTPDAQSRPPMTDEEFRDLDIGDVVVSRAFGSVVVVTANRGGRVTGVDAAEITNPREWSLLRKSSPRASNGENAHG